MTDTRLSYCRDGGNEKGGTSRTRDIPPVEVDEEKACTRNRLDRGVGSVYFVGIRVTVVEILVSQFGLQFPIRVGDANV